MTDVEREWLFRQEFADLYADLDLSSLLDKIAEKIRYYLDCQEASIFLYNSKREELYFETATGEKQAALKKIIMKKGEGVVGWIAANGQRLIINDCSQDTRFNANIDRQTDFKTISILGVPVMMENNLLGVLEAINKKYDHFDDEDAALLEYISGFIAIPLQNAMLFARITEETQEKEQLIELGKTISRAFDLNEVFDTLKRIITEILQPVAINVTVPSEKQQYRLMTGETIACTESPDLDEPVMEENGVIIPLQSGKKRLGLLEIITDNRIPEELLPLLKGLSVFAAISIEKFEMYTQMVEKERIEKEIQIARDIQQTFLINERVTQAGMDIAYINIPSSSVGGDYYHIIPLNEDEIILTTSDVAGHGIPASLHMAIFRANFVYRIKKDRDMSLTLHHLNNLFCETTERSHFVTSFTCKINLKERNLTYIRAGHQPALVCRAGQIIELAEGTLPIGWKADLPYDSHTFRIEPGDLVFLYTDGMIEAQNPDGELFSLARLKTFLSAHYRLGAEALKEKLIQELTHFAGGETFEDDITFILVKIAP